MNHKRIIFFYLLGFLAAACSPGLAEADTIESRPQNLLLIMSDDLKASALPAYGDTICKTPNLDRLAASAMVFDHAYCQGLACSPSRPSMMRSIYPHSTISAQTIGEHLQNCLLYTSPSPRDS